MGYVEPNTRYWRRAIELIDLTASVLRKHGLTSERIEAVSQSLREQTEFLLRVSEKNLADRRSPKRNTTRSRPWVATWNGLRSSSFARGTSR